MYMYYYGGPIAMLATSLNYMVETKQVFKNSIIKLHKISSNSLQGRKVMILFQFDVLVAEGIEKIGSPVAVDVVSTTPSVNTTATAPAPTVTQPYLQQNQNQNPTRVEPRVETQQPRSNPQLDASLFNIKGLNPYQERWTIKARVSFKSEVKTWHNARSQGKLFSVNFLDNSGEIKATIFNDQVDRLYNLLEEGKVYYVSRAKISMARKQFSTLDNEYELSLENGTEIELCNDDHAVPQVRFNFVKIADIENIEKGTNIDVIGVLKEDMGVQEIMTKATGKLSKKRELLIVDDTQKQIRVTLWGNTAENFSSSGSPVLAFKGCRVNDFQGKTLSLSQPGILKMDPDLSESRVLRQWFDKNDTTTSYSVFANQTGTGNGEYKPKEKLTLQQARTDNLGGTDVVSPIIKGRTRSMKLTLVYIRLTITVLKSPSHTLNLIILPTLPALTVRRSYQMKVLAGGVRSAQRCMLHLTGGRQPYRPTYRQEDSRSKINPPSPSYSLLDMF
ncbi:hypothetical protein BDF14DRAFT_1831812 [Spinellus fusiger]|nr:hypothetical protein BDF14DRAFT_1831812 [Spinellus fusiger]